MRKDRNLVAPQSFKQCNDLINDIDEPFVLFGRVLDMFDGRLVNCDVLLRHGVFKRQSVIHRVVLHPNCLFQRGEARSAPNSVGSTTLVIHEPIRPVINLDV